VISEGFMTSHRLQQSFYTDLTLQFSVNRSENNQSKWPEMVSAIIFWLHCRHLSFTLLQKTVSSEKKVKNKQITQHCRLIFKNNFNRQKLMRP